MRISDWSSDVCSSDLVVDPEDADAVVDPVQQHVPAGLPEGRAVGFVVRPEVDRVDVLVLLRRVLGVPDRTVGALGEPLRVRSEEHTSELQSLMRISYAVFCLKKKITKNAEQQKDQ